MGTPTDIMKLTEQMQRAKVLTDKAADSGKKSEVIMNNFEQTLTKYDEHVSKMKEYADQLDAMMAVAGNGGPPLTETFPPPVDVVHTVPTVVPSSVEFEVCGVAVSEVKPEG